MNKVSLLAYTPDAEKLVAMSAKLCYSNVGINKMKENLTEEKTVPFIEMLMKLGHESPLEHISFTFALEGISRALLAQITRHRIASYSVQSQRYVKNDNFQFIVPSEIEKIKEAKEEFLKAMKESLEHYEKITNILISKYENDKIDYKEAEKKAIEDARFVLPNASETKIICTFNARSLMNFFNHRCCNRAQWEIREVAKEMLLLVREVCPTIFKTTGPLCISGPCPEGRMSCGKKDEMIKIYLRKSE